jgi:hypothetical protein
VALAAQRKGHEVGFAVCAARCASLARLGFSVHACGADERDPDVSRVKKSAMADPGWAVRAMFAGIYAERMLPDLRTIVDRWRPDVIVSEVCEYAAWVVAERRGIPRAMVPFGIHWGFEVLEPMGAGPALGRLRQREGLDPDRWLMVLTPIGADQPFHADRCRDLGTAEVVERAEVTPVRLRDAIRTVLGASRHRAQAHVIREAMVSQPGTEAAVAVLEDLFTRGRS